MKLSFFQNTSNLNGTGFQSGEGFDTFNGTQQQHQSQGQDEDSDSSDSGDEMLAKIQALGMAEKK